MCFSLDSSEDVLEETGHRNRVWSEDSPSVSWPHTCICIFSRTLYMLTIFTAMNDTEIQNKTETVLHLDQSRTTD